MPNRPLEHKTIVIIGGTTGLGLSGAAACIEAGAQVVVVGRNEEHAASAVDQLGLQSRAIVGDATDSETSRRAIQLAVTEFGKLDALYHVAGGSGRKQGDGPLDAITDEGWDFTLRLNLSSLFYSNRAAIQQFLAQKSPGAILNMGSVLGFSPAPRHFATHAYAAAKAAIEGLSKSAAAYYAPQNIRINIVTPALVETPMSERAVGNDAIMQYVRTKQPLDGGRVGQPSDIDGAVVYFLSDQSRFVTGQTLAIDGGWTVTEGQAE
jgi:NAD(P)-dependent dehydrogenase (short-subunit alcohol dehydrogenase family)